MLTSMTVYRGYRIEVEDEEGRCRVGIHPTRPHLPILRHYWVFVWPSPENCPLNEAKRRIDHALEFKA